MTTTEFLKLLIREIGLQDAIAVTDEGIDFGDTGWTERDLGQAILSIPQRRRKELVEGDRA